MQTKIIFAVFIGYSLLLLLIGFITSKKANNQSFFNAGKSSPWFVVSYGMIGASLSGITFISVPGNVINSNFSYLVMVFGYFIGYFLIATVLLPLYYKLNLTSIYTYLLGRFGFYTHKTGASFFLLSRIIGASLRMFIVISILQTFIFEPWDIPFWVTVMIFVILIWAYTNRGGIKTVIWTDTLQTTFMLASVGITIYLISQSLHLSLFEIWNSMETKGYSKMFYFTEWKDSKYFLKMFFSGTFIALAMTGLDQDMMQKNLTCRNLKEAKKNILTLGALLIPINFIFLFLGAALYIYGTSFQIDLPQDSDHVFSFIAFKLGILPGIIFLIGLIAAAYSSADSALTSLTTSFSIDILNLQNSNASVESKEKTRKIVHLSVSILIIFVIVLLNTFKNEAIITILFKIAGYTYGPLLGLFTYGLITKRKVIDHAVPFIAIASPLLTYLISLNSEKLFWGYKFGFELLILNALIMIIGLLIFRQKENNSQ